MNTFLSSTWRTIDQELVVRAAQCHALMPMMQYSVAPWRILSQENLAICLEMAALHVEMGEKILELARDAGIAESPLYVHWNTIIPDRVMNYHRPVPAGKRDPGGSGGCAGSRLKEHRIS